MAMLLSGKEVAAGLNERLSRQVERLREEQVVPTLAILRVGERPDDLSYERSAMKRCEKLGVEARQVTLPADCTQQDLLQAIQGINEDASIHGCLMLRPLPRELDEYAACEALRPEKDVDCITSGSLARVFTGKGAGYAPCTAEACMEILDYYHCELGGQKAVVVGRSLVIGKPVSMLLLARNATVTICHTRTRDLAAECQKADVLVVAAGKAGAVDGSCISRGQVVVDVGIHMDEDGKMCGDVDFATAEPLAGAITPVPGGVGAVTTAVLLRHVVEAAAAAAGVQL